MFPDHFVMAPMGARRTIERILFDLRPGVTEVYLHPAVDTDELRSSHPDWASRVEDHATLCHDAAFANLLDRAGVDAYRLPPAARPPTRRRPDVPGGISTRRRSAQLGLQRLVLRASCVIGSSCMNLPMLPVTFMRPCMNAAFASSSPFWIFTESSYERVIVKSASSSLPSADSRAAGRPPAATST